jgi:dTDP-glucose 4,6-dehydratase
MAMRANSRTPLEGGSEKSTLADADSLSARRVLVTGGAGFLGSSVVRELCHAGAKVTVLDNFSSGKKEYLNNITHTNGLNVIAGDICDVGIVEKSMREIELVIHLAALPFIPDSYYHPRDFFKTNVDGTLNLLLAASKADTVERFVYISSSEVYGSARQVPMDENHPTLPHSSYAASKLAADRVTFTISKELGLPVAIVRPFNTFGPNITQPYIVPEIIAQVIAGDGELWLGNTEARRDLTYVDDTARGIVLSAIGPVAEGDVINLGSGNSISVKELALKITSLMGRTLMIRNDASRLRPFDVGNLVCDNSKAEKILNWKPIISLDEGLKRTIDWVKSNSIHFQSPFRNWYRTNKITTLVHPTLSRS